MLIVGLFLLTGSASAQFRYGGGITLGSKSSLDDDLSDKWGIGANIRGLYQITDKVGVSGGFTYFFPNDPTFMDVDLDIEMWQVNADIHYSIVNMPVRLYALAGLNLSHIKIDASLFTESVSEDATEVGVDLGAGLSFDFGAFAELKYDTKFEQVAITVGFMF